MQPDQPDRYWFARHSKSIVFLICILTAVGIYEALTLPVAVFPTTNFPRIIVGVDNGVAPIDQMQVTVTRKIEEAVNSVQGLEKVQSVTSRGTAEIDLFAAALRAELAGSADTAGAAEPAGTAIAGGTR